MATTGQTGYKKVAPIIFQDKHYGPLFQNYVDTIINSGLLAEEDLKLLVYTCELSSKEASTSSAFPFELKLILSLICLFWISQFIPYGIAGVSIFSLFFIAYKIEDKRDRKSEYKLISELIIVLRDMGELIEKVYNYFQERKDIRNNYTNMFLIEYNMIVGTFFYKFFEGQRTLNQFYLNKIKDILLNKYILLDTVISAQSQPRFDEEGVQEYLVALEKFVKTNKNVELIHSRLLGFLGALLCKERYVQPSWIVYILIPEFIETTRQEYENLKSLMKKMLFEVEGLHIVVDSFKRANVLSVKNRKSKYSSRL